jgi:hypothetical protein
VITTTAPIGLKGNHKEGLVSGVARAVPGSDARLAGTVDLRPAQFNREEVFDEQGQSLPRMSPERAALGSLAGPEESTASEKFTISPSPNHFSKHKP